MIDILDREVFLEEGSSDVHLLYVLWAAAVVSDQDDDTGSEC